MKPIRKFRNSRWIKRWKAKTSAPFRKVIKLGITVGAVGAAIPLAPFTLPAFIIGLSPTLISIGGTAAIVSKLTVENKEEIEK